MTETITLCFNRKLNFQLKVQGTREIREQHAPGTTMSPFLIDFSHIS